ncbi:MAG: hypothetical protein M1819_002731 [Sarea resinae]|nr:MAG: hypothetical protein M1819_002731 [Sarea resinae]
MVIHDSVQELVSNQLSLLHLRKPSFSTVEPLATNPVVAYPVLESCKPNPHTPSSLEFSSPSDLFRGQNQQPIKDQPHLQRRPPKLDLSYQSTLVIFTMSSQDKSDSQASSPAENGLPRAPRLRPSVPDVREQLDNLSLSAKAPETPLSDTEAATPAITSDKPSSDEEMTDSITLAHRPRFSRPGTGPDTKATSSTLPPARISPVLMHSTTRPMPSMASPLKRKSTAIYTTEEDDKFPPRSKVARYLFSGVMERGESSGANDIKGKGKAIIKDEDTTAGDDASDDGYVSGYEHALPPTNPPQRVRSKYKNPPGLWWQDRRD